MSTMIEVMNTIRANASAAYVARVPDATVDNIAAVSDPILTYSTTQNEFLSLLVNKIALTIVHNKIASNPMRILKKGGSPLGKDIEEIFTNPATAETFDGTGSTLLTVNKPDTKVIYHRLNRQDVYTVTVSNAQLRQAFTSWDKLNELIASITATLYSGDNYDEYILFKNLMKTAIVANEVVVVEVDAIVDEATGKSFVKAIKTTSKAMQHPSSAFNKYLANAPIGDTSGKPVITWTPKSDQVLILRSDISASIDVDVLAVAFNLSKVELETMMVEIDAFGELTTDPDIYAILADKAWFQVYDNMQEMNEFYNPKGLYWNYFWHHWQTYSYSLFANAVAFKKKAGI